MSRLCLFVVLVVVAIAVDTVVAQDESTTPAPAGDNTTAAPGAASVLIVGVVPILITFLCNLVVAMVN